ncbi:coiled-coil domain-containing protein [Stieleria varia]|uniref:Chromosome partition protein Smc n=1 Tax=Stieleria varia TaxID=2528005 RepID=A0A5C6APS8_9BACT|nr:hypothetical protein [Stieleria varia]TWU00972.1 hypothetical protein Pla52n_43420 [Stieleria varia]
MLSHWLAKSIIGGVLFLVLLVTVSNTHLLELVGYLRATADETVEELQDNVPQAVRDRKLKNELDHARDQIVDRRVQLSLAESKTRKLDEEIESLTARVARREDVLAEAYPALEQASKNQAEMITFAGKQWKAEELAAQVDDLLSQQELDEQQLQIRTEALTRYQESIKEGNAVISQMELELVRADNEIAGLKLRREQARQESDLLELVSAQRDQGSVHAGIRSDLDKLRDSVDEEEARNQAHRAVSGGVLQKSELSQSWERMERLKALHEKRQSKLESAQSNDDE